MNHGIQCALYSVYTGVLYYIVYFCCTILYTFVLYCVLFLEHMPILVYFSKLALDHPSLQGLKKVHRVLFGYGLGYPLFVPKTFKNLWSLLLKLTKKHFLGHFHRNMLNSSINWQKCSKMKGFSQNMYIDHFYW